MYSQDEGVMIIHVQVYIVFAVYVYFVATFYSVDVNI